MKKYRLILYSVIAVIASSLLLFSLNSLSQKRKHKNQVVNNVRQFVLACHIYPNNSDSVWPTNLKFLVSVLPEIKNEVEESGLKTMLNEEEVIYVRPVSNPTSDQPVIISNPKLFNQNQSIVGYADGHVGYVDGDEIWKIGKKLIQRSYIYDDDKGISMKDWRNQMNVNFNE